MAILISFVVALAVNAAFFAIAATRSTDVVTDLSYSFPITVPAIVLPRLGAHEPIQLAASLLVLVWAARLAVDGVVRVAEEPELAQHVDADEQIASQRAQLAPPSRARPTSARMGPQISMIQPRR